MITALLLVVFAIITLPLVYEIVHLLGEIEDEE